eukprot:COSAG06_NODE_1675_length_8744_cov_5.951764_4_plen_383_part_00
MAEAEGARDGGGGAEPEPEVDETLFFEDYSEEEDDKFSHSGSGGGKKEHHSGLGGGGGGGVGGGSAGHAQEWAAAVDTLIELGFTDGAAIADALTQTNGAVEPALELLWATGGGGGAVEEEKKEQPVAAAVRDDEQRAQHDLFVQQNHHQQQKKQQQPAVPVVVDDDEDYDDDDDIMDDGDDAVEYRVDASDGCAYTKSEFMAEYGGLDQWHASVILGAASGTATAAAVGDETDRYTPAGGGGGERDWDKLAAAGLDPLRAPKPKPKQKQAAAAPHGRQTRKQQQPQSQTQQQQQGDAAQRGRRSATHSAADSSRADGAGHSSSTAAPSALVVAGQGAVDVGAEGVTQLVEMGFPRARALAALEQARGDRGAAMELLLAELC